MNYIRATLCLGPADRGREGGRYISVMDSGVNRAYVVTRLRGNILVCGEGKIGHVEELVEENASSGGRTYSPH